MELSADGGRVVETSTRVSSLYHHLYCSFHGNELFWSQHIIWNRLCKICLNVIIFYGRINVVLKICPWSMFYIFCCTLWIGENELQIVHCWRRVLVWTYLLQIITCLRRINASQYAFTLFRWGWAPMEWCLQSWWRCGQDKGATPIYFLPGFANLILKEGHQRWIWFPRIRHLKEISHTVF